MQNLFWFIVAAAALGLAFVLQSPYMAFAVYTFLLLVGLAHFSSLAWLSGLDCTRTLSKETALQGEEVSIKVVVENKRGWPIPWIFIEDYHPKDFPRMGQNKQLAFLMPGHSVTLEYRLQCPRRGYHRIGPLLMESGDLFGLQRRFRTGVQQDYLSVLPTVAYIDTFNVATKRPHGPVRLSNRIYTDPTRINSIREYIPGDPLNTIHWKATARTGKLHVKTYEPSSVIGGTLVLDLHDASYKPERKEERMELAITTTASIAYLLQISGEQVGMITNARDAAEVAQYEIEKRETLSRQEVDAEVEGELQGTRISPLCVETSRTPYQAQRIIENLARVLPTDGLDGMNLVMNQYHMLPRDATLMIIAPIITERMAHALGAIKLSGFNVSVFLIMDQRAYEEAARFLAPHNIHVFHIEHERSLHEISPAKIG
ncbi:MAG: DUF58 domain-containing protein [Candidatus Hydrogenedentes bacterium]|nr:DUF58 domain-containing protein [Candidatus Hydrogenedentota bacterium]